MHRPWVAVVLLGLVCILGLAERTEADSFELNSGTGGFVVAAGEGGGRGIGFRADSTFSILSVAIQADLLLQSYDVVVWSSTDGNQANALLDSATAVVGGSGFGFYDIALNFTFTAGNFYALGWRPNAGGISDWTGAGGLQYYSDSGLPVTVGPTTLINGFEGYDATAVNFDGNILHPNLRIQTAVPEPGTLLLLGIGLLGLGGRVRRKQSS